ncbi:NADPH dehydrogenase [Malassezia sp. CBS 17886]|nr:NADPH dehydrogenase [Malassezia sp. CBS 17886]
MADVWISRKRWTCKYCNVTINDDVPSRRHHENGLRHKGNVERALRNLYEENDAQRREALRKQKEIQGIEKAARGSYNAYDASGGAGAAPDVPRAAPVAPPRKPASWKPTNQMAMYTTAESLGVKDDGKDEWNERVARRKGAAFVGAWETVASPQSGARRAAPPREPAPPPAQPTEREQAQRFELVEQSLDTAHADADDLPAIGPVRKRPRGSDGGAADAGGMAVKEEGDVAVKEEGDVGEGPAGMSPERGVWSRADCTGGAPRVKEEGDGSADATAPTVTAAAARTSPAPSAGDLFRKRRARSGTAKKVGGSAFA